MHISIIMDFCSLEEEDVGDIFLTQESREIVPLIPNFEVESDIEMVETRSTQNTNRAATQYSDISDEEDVTIQSSQIPNNVSENR